MNRRKALKVSVDAAMAVTLVGIMSTALVQEAPHEWLGMALFVLMAIHLVLNRKWLAAVMRARRNALHVLRIVVLVGLIACLVGQLASSLVISKHAFGFLPALPGSGWARAVHMLCSYWMFVLVFAHVGLHLRAPKGMASGKLRVLHAVLVAIACYGVYSFVQLGVFAYLTGQVQFAAADFGAPFALTFARYASIGVLVAGGFRCVRALADGSAKPGKTSLNSRG